MYLPSGGQDLSQLSVDIVDVDADVRRSNDGDENSRGVDVDGLIQSDDYLGVSLINLIISAVLMGSYEH